VNPAKVRRETTVTLTDLPNIGTAMAKDLRSIGIGRPQQLVGCDASELYVKQTAGPLRARHPDVGGWFYERRGGEGVVGLHAWTQAAASTI